MEVTPAAEVAAALGLAVDAVLSPGDVIVLMTWRDRDAAAAFEDGGVVPDGMRLR